VKKVEREDEKVAQSRVHPGARREIATGDHVAVLSRDTAELGEVTDQVTRQCVREGWALLYISRFPEKNPAIGKYGEKDLKDRGISLLSHGDPKFHRIFSTTETVRAYIKEKVREAQEMGYTALCIMREGIHQPTLRSSQRLVSDMADLAPLFLERDMLMVCVYKLEGIPPLFLQDILRTHPLVILDGRVVENLFYIQAADAQRYNLPSLEVQHWLTTLRELSRTTEALNENEALYRDLLENASDLIQSVDPGGKFLYVNRTWREKLGYTAEDLRTITLFDIIDPVSLRHCQDLFTRVLKGEDVGIFKTIFRAKSGKKVLLEGRVNCFIQDGKPQHTRGIFRDITEQEHT